MNHQTQDVLFLIIKDLAIKVMEIIWDMKGFSSFFFFLKQNSTLFIVREIN